MIRMKLQRLNFVIVGLLLFLIFPVQGQIVYQEYVWEEGDFTLRYPATWEQPIVTTMPETGSVTLRLSQSSADTSEASPFIMIQRSTVPLDFVDVETALRADLADINITQVATSQPRLLNSNVMQVDGFSADSMLYGIARGIILPENGDILILIGSGSNQQRDEIRAIFEIVADSFISGAGAFTENPDYGVLWHSENLIGDSDDAPFDLAAIALDEVNNRLYVIDNLQGVLVLDSQTGREIERIAFPDDIEHATISDAVYGTVFNDTGLFVADSLCNCVYILTDGEWRFPIPGSSIAGHRSITITENRLAETVVDEAGQILIPLSAADDTFVIELSEEITLTQPLLAADTDSNLLMLTEAGDIYRFENDVPELLFNVPTGAIIQDFAVDVESNFVVLTDTEGILILNRSGEAIYNIGQIAGDIPRAGELLNPKAITVDSNGTIYWIDSDGSYSTVTAMSLFVEAGNQGRNSLIAGLPVQGVLRDGQSQSWFYDADAGDIINIGVFADLESSDIDPQLRIIAADGMEIAHIDNTADDDEFLLNPFDLYLKNIALPQADTYRLIVESDIGSGSYIISLASQREIDVTNPVSVTGYLAEQLPVERWVFAGQSGQTLNISVLPNNNLLDPSLRLYAPGGTLLAENADALDESLFPGAALDDIILPQSGTYVIEAVHFSGEGSYTLAIESN